MRRRHLLYIIKLIWKKYFISIPVIDNNLSYHSTYRMKIMQKSGRKFLIREKHLRRDG